MTTQLNFLRLVAGSGAEEIAKERKPASDRVVMTSELSDRLDKLWDGPGAIMKGRPVPADLIISGEVPLQNVEIQEHDLLIQIIVSPGALALTESGGCGALFISQPRHPERWGGREIFATLFVEYDLNALSVGDVFVPEGIGLTERQVEYLEMAVMRAVGDWYGIQVALLHPQIKDVFQRAKLAPVRKANRKRKKKQRVARYVRTHYIKSQDVDEAVSRSGTIERKTLCWYVIGHWRHYSNGTKKFIRGYWKGPLREVQRNLDEGRRRIIEA